MQSYWFSLSANLVTESGITFKVYYINGGTILII